MSNLNASKTVIIKKNIYIKQKVAQGTSDLSYTLERRKLFKTSNYLRTLILN